MRALVHAAALMTSVLALAVPVTARAGAQAYEPLSASVQAVLHKSISDQAVPYLAFESEAQARRWLNDMSRRLADRMPDRYGREAFLVSVHYEAKRAGLDPQMVLGVIQVESNFRKYAVSRAGARGYMQVMPFWRDLIGNDDHNLFHLRTNLRYGCVILRYYLDMEKGNLYRALGRYNGSLGRSKYPNMVVRAWKRDWNYAADSTAERVVAHRH